MHFGIKKKTVNLIKVSNHLNNQQETNFLMKISQNCMNFNNKQMKFKMKLESDKKKFKLKLINILNYSLK